jgi:hypothetical protein
MTLWGNCNLSGFVATAHHLIRRQLTKPFNSHVNHSLPFAYLQSQQMNQLALPSRTAFDVSLGRQKRAMTGQELNIAQGATSFMGSPGCLGDKCPSSAVRAASVEIDFAI